jgi:signal transduction histidine kinase
LEDSHHNIWIGTPTGGLNLFDPLTEKFIYFQHDPDNENSLCNDIVLSLHEDKNHQLWIGTSGGLSKLLPKIDQHIFQKLSGATKEKKVSWFKNFGHEQGFPNDVIYGILEDNHRHLWLSTNKGLVTFDMDKEAVTRKWDISDGLQSNEFNQNGYYKNDKGFFYFGGVNGFNIFHPDSIRGNRYIPPVVLTGLSLYNEPVKLGSGTSKGELLLEKALCGLDQITLSWRHDVVTFEFVALSYHTPEKNQYSYKLEGFNEEWVQAGNSHTATYTNLDPGDYVFKVRASNSSGIWNETGTALKIKISTPPWLSWYAWLLYCCVGAGAVYLFLRYRIDKATMAIKVEAQIEKARAEEREEFRKNSAADFHDEAGNKITKITLFTEMARAEINDKQQLENYLKKIQLNTAELSSGMRDFLWVMDSQRDTLYETITRLKDFGEAILTETGIRFTVSGMNPASRQIILPMKIRRAILQIFKEAMNNCAKHASASDVILEIKVAENEIEMVLRDNGKGFDPDEERDKNHYGLKIMQERALKIGANLDIRTLKNKGTTISLICKIPQVGNS